MVNEGKSIFEFGPFQLDVSEHLLLHNESTVPLTPKAFELLLMLVQNSGHILEKDKIIREIWLDTFVGEATLAQNVFTLRKALGDNQDERQYIETIPKRGYRFIANVKEVRPEGPRTGRRARVPASKQEGGIKTDDSAIASVAILPLINATEDPRAEYLSDGITETIINKLSQISQLRFWRAAPRAATRVRKLMRAKLGKNWGCAQFLWAGFFK